MLVRFREPPYTKSLPASGNADDLHFGPRPAGGDFASGRARIRALLPKPLNRFLASSNPALKIHSKAARRHDYLKPILHFSGFIHLPRRSTPSIHVIRRAR